MSPAAVTELKWEIRVTGQVAKQSQGSVRLSRSSPNRAKAEKTASTEQWLYSKYLSVGILTLIIFT